MFLCALLLLISACEMPAFVTHTKKKDGYRQLVCTELICRHKRMMEKQGKMVKVTEAKPEAVAALEKEAAPEPPAIAHAPERAEVADLQPERVPEFPDAVDLKIEPAVSSNLLFRFGKAELISDRIPELDTLANFLTRNTQYRIGIYGHTDAMGSDAVNDRLSEARAKTVATYLVRGGVAPERLSWHGYGSSKPIATNDSANGREKNRRVEFIVNP